MKTSITLSADLLDEVDRICDGEPRSALIERVLRAYVRRRLRAETDARDLERINEAAEALNAEAEEVLLYQSLPEE